MPAHRPFFVVRNPGTGLVRKVGHVSVEGGMQEILLTNGSTEAALDHPEAVFLSPKARKKAAKQPAQRKKTKR